MFPSYPPPHPLHYQPSVGAAYYPRPAPLATSHVNSSHDFDRMIQSKYADGYRKLNATISRFSFSSPATRQECLDLVKYLHIYRNLFVHTFRHLVSCQNGQLRHLVHNAGLWKGWGSIGQLVHHALIRDELLRFWLNPCPQHGFPPAEHSVKNDDYNDLLYHLLCCGRKRELYRLGNIESEQVVELLWQFLVERQENVVARRLRAQIYRMARKSAYLPYALRIGCSSISNRRSLGASANARVTRATMDGNDVVIKEILCSDPDTQRKCLEMFASEAILWKTLRHKNIVPFMGVIAEATLSMGLVSPFFKNGNIRNYIQNYETGRWPTMAQKFGKELAEALHYIHSHEPPIVHGDLKGDNILVDDAGHARLGDFGQTYASDSGKYLDSTRVGLATCNPLHWMAPELIQGGDRVKASDKSDIYSYGCVLYEMVSGKIPFEGFETGRVLKCVLRGQRPNRPAPISNNHLLWGVINECWGASPIDRPSAGNLVTRFH